MHSLAKLFNSLTKFSYHIEFKSIPLRLTTHPKSIESKRKPANTNEKNCAQAWAINKWLKGDYLWPRFRFNAIHMGYARQSHWQLCRATLIYVVFSTIGNRTQHAICSANGTPTERKKKQIGCYCSEGSKREKKNNRWQFTIEFWFRMEFRDIPAVAGDNNNNFIITYYYQWIDLLFMKTIEAAKRQ